MTKAAIADKKRILLVDDDQASIAPIESVLVANHFEVVSLNSGKLAQERLGLEHFDLVISDIHMPNSRIGGMELLQYSIQQRKAPVILMTGFATLSETSQASQMGAAAFLAKPFKKDELIAIVRSTCGLDANQADEPKDLDDQFSKLNIDDFVSGRQISFSIHVRLSASKYVKIAHSGEDLSIDRIHSYKSMGIKHLWLERSDFNRYIRMGLSLAERAKNTKSIAPQKTLNLMKHTTELILEKLHSEEIDAEAFEDAKNIVESTVSFLAEDQACLDILAALNSHSDYLYAHSLGVSLYSSLIVRKLKWDSPSTVFRTSIGGLFHDVGKKEIDRALLDKPRGSYSSDEVKLIESHPSRGVEILARLESVPEDVIQIVLHYHERDSGSGYPSGLRKNRIHPLARVISVADEFCKLVLKGPDSPGMSLESALSKIQLFFGETLDKASMTALAQILKKNR